MQANSIRRSDQSRYMPGGRGHRTYRYCVVVIVASLAAVLILLDMLLFDRAISAEQLSSEIAVAPPTITISGRVLDSRGCPIAGAIVHARAYGDVDDDGDIDLVDFQLFQLQRDEADFDYDCDVDLDDWWLASHNLDNYWLVGPKR